MDECHRILSVSNDIHLKELRNAFIRKLSKAYSSGDNSAIKSVISAYEYLYYTKTKEVFDMKSISFYQPKDEYHDFKDWFLKEETQLDYQVQQIIAIGIEEYLKKRFEGVSGSFEALSNFLMIAKLILIFIGCPLIGYMVQGTTGLIVGIVIIVLSVPYWAGYIRDLRYVNYEDFVTNLNKLFFIRKFQIFIGIIINIILLFRFGLITMIPVPTLLISLTGIILMGYFVSKVFQNKLNRLLVISTVFPFLFNLFFIVNYYFSSNPVQEKYTFTLRKEIVRDETNPYVFRTKVIEVGLLYLEDEAYSRYPGVRIVGDYDKLKGKTIIRYVFEQGAFGLRVRKSYALY